MARFDDYAFQYRHLFEGMTIAPYRTTAMAKKVLALYANDIKLAGAIKNG